MLLIFGSVFDDIHVICKYEEFSSRFHQAVVDILNIFAVAIDIYHFCLTAASTQTAETKSNKMMSKVNKASKSSIASQGCKGRSTSKNIRDLLSSLINISGINNMANNSFSPNTASFPSSVTNSSLTNTSTVFNLSLSINQTFNPALANASSPQFASTATAMKNKV